MRFAFAAALTASFIASVSAAQAQVKIGVVNSLSGNFATFGERYRTGLQVALDEINGKGGINGQRLELAVQDDKSEAQSALAAAEALDGQGVPLIIGSYASSITGPMAQFLTRRRVPLIVLGSADDSITRPGSPWVFRAKHNSTIVATAYFNYFDYLKKKKKPDVPLATIAMLYGNGAWPTSLAKAGKSFAEERGYKVVADQAYDQGVTDFRPILNRFRGAQPDILYIVSYADDGVAITRQLREVGLNGKVIAIDTSAALPNFIQQVGDLSEYVATAVSWSKDVQYPGAQDLYERLKARAGSEPSFYEAEGYLALVVAADALRRAGSTSRDTVREALEKTDLQTPVTTVKFDDFDGFQNQNPIRSLILQIQNGQHVTVFPAELSPAEVRHPTPPWSER